MPKFDLSQVDRSLTPMQASSEPKTVKSKMVLWGGTILDGKNFKLTTRLEILAYPLDKDGWPDRSKKPLGRFFMIQQGYLETADYAQGRLLSIVGAVTGIQQGKVGETRYAYPVIQASQLHLWPKSGRKSDTSVHFGVGVVFH